MAGGKYLIDLTDERLKIPANDDVMRFIRVANPFAHTDVGGRLLELGKELTGATAYCPSYRSCAYVVLHTETNRIFAIAFGQRGLAFRLPAAARAEAVADGGVPTAEIGADWVGFAAYDGPGESGAEARLRRWCAAAFAGADGASAP